MSAYAQTWASIREAGDPDSLADAVTTPGPHDARLGRVLHQINFLLVSLTSFSN